MFYFWTVDMKSASMDHYGFEGTDAGYVSPVRGGN